MGGTRVCDRFTPALPSPLQSPRALPAFNASLPARRGGPTAGRARLWSGRRRGYPTALVLPAVQTCDSAVPSASSRPES